MKLFLHLCVLLLCFHQITNSQSLHDKIDTSLHSFDLATVNHAKTIVDRFVTHMIRKESVDSLLNRCSVPFALDGQMIETKDQLRMTFIAVLKSVTEGGHQIVLDSTYVFGRREEILNGLIPINVYFVVTTIKYLIGDQKPTKQIVFAVHIGEVSKIIGITAE